MNLEHCTVEHDGHRCVLYEGLATGPLLSSVTPRHRLYQHPRPGIGGLPLHITNAGVRFYRLGDNTVAV